MKISEKQVRQIIREEFIRVLSETPIYPSNEFNVPDKHVFESASN
jgi:hypothetical protein